MSILELIVWLIAGANTFGALSPGGACDVAPLGADKLALVLVLGRPPAVQPGSPAEARVSGGTAPLEPALVSTEAKARPLMVSLDEVLV